MYTDSTSRSTEYTLIKVLTCSMVLKTNALARLPTAHMALARGSAIAMRYHIDIVAVAATIS